MRLTLRTLLAYLDDLLEGPDARVLESKIKEGKVASRLVDRIREVVANPKLAAPKVDATGMAGDANTVSEYLDNTLGAQHVIDFEQVCLGEDARLAEVAACHHVLALVLERPVEVSPELRQRIKSIGLVGSAANANLKSSARVERSSINAGSISPGNHTLSDNTLSSSNVQESHGTAPSRTIELGSGANIRIDRAHSETISDKTGSQDSNGQSNESKRQTESNEDLSTATIAASRRGISKAAASHGLEINEQLGSQVPEYLRAGTNKAWTEIISTAVLIAALMCVAWFSIGSWENVQRMMGTYDPNNKVAEVPAKANDGVSLMSGANEIAAPASNENKANDNVAGVVDQGAKPITAETESASTDSADRVEKDDMDIEATNEAMANEGVPPSKESIADQLQSIVGQSNENRNQDGSTSEEPTDPSDADTVENKNATPAVANRANPQPNSKMPQAIVWLPETKESSESLVFAVAPSAPGTLDVRRLIPGEFVGQRDRIVIPPAYRTQLRIYPGLRWEVADASDISIMPTTDPNTASVELKLGRGMVSGTPECQNLKLLAGGLSTHIDLHVPGSIAAIELKYEQVHGATAQSDPINAPNELADDVNEDSDPALQQANINNGDIPRRKGLVRSVLSITCVAESIEVRVADGDPVQLAVGKKLEWDSGESLQQLSITEIPEIPWWFRSSYRRAIDGNAAKELLTTINSVTPTPVKAAPQGAPNGNGKPNPPAPAAGPNNASKEALPEGNKPSAPVAAPPVPNPPVTTPPAAATPPAGPAGPGRVVATPLPPAPPKALSPSDIMETLLVASTSRRSETATLAVQTLALLGDFSRLLGADGVLANPSSRPHRPIIIETLYQSIGIDSERETALEKILRETDASRTDLLIRLLLLPDDIQLENGADRFLVNMLSSPFADERVLSIHQLSSITGKDYGYQCEQPNTESLQQWKRLLASKKIRWSKARK